jgi:uncharacterized protein YegL
MSNIGKQMLGPTQAVTNLGGPGFVPPKLGGLKRYPFLLLVDVSGSTGDGHDPDINHINRSIDMFLDMMRNPAPNGQLATKIDAIDIAIVAYNQDPITVLPWSTARNLPGSIPPLSAGGSTATGKAFDFAISLCGERLRYYRDPANAFPYGMPNIIHLTDGAITDMQPGDPLWTTLQSQITVLNKTNGETSTQGIGILHFISPRGVMAQTTQTLAAFSGAATVFDMTKDIHTFDQLVKFLTCFVTSITQAYGPGQAIASSVSTAGGMSPTQTY